ncbi:hypothetical protein Tco_0148445, partial [Tanacetum coccineum]
MRRIIQRMIWNWELLCSLLRLGDIICMDYTIAITPESPTKEPVNSLSLEDEHLDTISATESDEFIKSSVEIVENLVPTPIEFEDFSDDECDLPPYDDL